MLPTRKAAEYELTVGGEFHPGTWITQSYNIACTAYEIAKKCDGLEEEKAYILGILHNIGRREVGSFHPAYAYEGYKYCIRNGWDEIAKICITYAYPLKEIEITTPLSQEEVFIKQYLSYCTYDDYDKLLILCNALVGTYQMKTLERRFIEVTIGDQVNELFLARWNTLFEMKEYFEHKMGCTIYEVLQDTLGYDFGECVSLGRPTA